MNRRKIFKFAAIGIGLAVLLGWLIFSYLPGVAHQKTLAALERAGFDTSFIGKPAAIPGALLYTDLVLDADQISTIKKLKIDYSPFGLLLFGHLKSADIYELSLTGELQDEGPLMLSVSGWKPQAVGLLLNAFPGDELSIRKSRISLLTKDFGGVTVEFDLQGTRKKNRFEFQSRIKSEQKRLSIIANMSGVAGPNYWNTDMEIEQGKIDLPYAETKLTRVNGWANLSQNDGSDPFKIMSELRAGGANILGFPLQNASATAEIKTDSYKIFAEGNSVGHEGTELSLNILKDPGNGPPHISGTVFSDHVPEFLTYLQSSDLLNVSKKAMKPFEKAKNISAAFVVDPAQGGIEPRLRYRIVNEDHKTEKHGQIFLEKFSDTGGVFSPGKKNP